MTCCACQAATKDGVTLCPVCLSTLRGRLADVDWLIPELEIVLTRQTRYTVQKIRAKSRVPGLPWDERAAARLLSLRATLEDWARRISRPGDVMPGPHALALAQWLRRNLDRLASSIESGYAFYAITESIDRAKICVDRPPDRLIFGMCGNEETGVPCSAYLYGTAEDGEVVCQVCRARYDVAERREEMLEQVRMMWGTAAQVSYYLSIAGIKISEDAIRSMAHRNRIRPVNPDAKTPLFRFSDVIEAARNRYQRTKKPCKEGT